LLRLSAAGMLLTLVIPRSQAGSSPGVFAGLAVLAVFVVLGAFTPIVSILCCSTEIAAIFSVGHPDALCLLFAVVNTAALGLLGPGGYSLDARVFGRRRVVLSTEDDAEF
ncbi:MAG: hypothetical protein WA510_28280, partial [Acidobacteriaceae bacterium]